MAKKARIELYLDFTKYNTVLSDRSAQLVAVDVRNLARKNVRVKSGRLRNSIRTDGLGFATYVTIAETPYALAQEYGRPDLAQYGFTPYMRPASKEATSKSRLQKSVDAASQAALNVSRINKTL